MAAVTVDSLAYDMANLFNLREARAGVFSDEDIECIRRLLKELGKPTWSARPRTYAILKMMGKDEEWMEVFVKAGLLDIELPYTLDSLPLFINRPDDRKRFVEAQQLLLTDAKVMERRGHALLATDSNRHFQVVRALGQGGFGEVSEVISLLSSRRYARKTILRRNFLYDQPENGESFRNELKALKTLSHRHLIEYIGSYTDPTFFGILLDPVAECNLREYLENPPDPPDFGTIRQFFGCMASGIAYLHDRHFRHKDLKPSNILLRGSHIYISDFGLALDWSDQSKSRTEGTIGAWSPDYAAPEVFTHQPRGSSTDMWSLGCIFLEMTTVLNCETLKSRRDFFKVTGSKGSNPCTNPEAYSKWMEKLDLNNDKPSLEWTKQLLVVDLTQRLTARELLKKIANEAEKQQRFYICYVCKLDITQPTSLPTITQNMHEDTELNEIGDIPTTLPSIQSGLHEAVSKNDLDTVRFWLKRWENQFSGAIDCQSSLSHTNSRQIASREGYIEIVKDLLKFGFNTDAKLNGSLPLHLAAEHDRTEVIHLLLEQGASIEAQDDKFSSTALHFAASCGSISSVKLLLEHGANINAQNLIQATPLHAAISSRHERVVELLLQHQEIDTTLVNNHSLNPLHFAASYGNGKIVELLCQYGANVNAQSPHLGSTPLHMAITQQMAASVRILVERGANVNICQTGGNRSSPLHLAVKATVEIIEQLFIYNNVDQAIVDAENFTALDRAVQDGNIEVVSMLLKKGFDISKVKKDERHIPPLIIALKHGNIAMVELLLKYNAPVKITNAQNGGSPLHYLAAEGEINLINLLIRHKADVNAQDLFKMTPLMVAAASGRAEIVRTFIRHGADVRARGFKFETALHLAAQAQRKTVVKILLDHGADPTAQDFQLDTPLHFAAIHGTVAVAQLLLDHGAQVDVKNSRGQTPLNLASENNKSDITELLEHSNTKGGPSNGSGDESTSPIKMESMAEINQALKIPNPGLGDSADEPIILNGIEADDVSPEEE
ncbi:hypothetical protein FQN57_003645 [Myotisia sp. PD_48]|nr:hypothetical protein FQN57_003645 [Myotisia sp. PD_48]